MERRDFLNSDFDHDEDTEFTKTKKKILTKHCLDEMETIFEYISDKNLNSAAVNYVEKQKIMEAIESDPQYSDILNMLIEGRNDHKRKTKQAVDQKLSQLTINLDDLVEDKKELKQKEKELEKIIEAIENVIHNGDKGDHKKDESLALGSVTGALAGSGGACVGVAVGVIAGLPVGIFLGLALMCFGSYGGVAKYQSHRESSQKEYRKQRPGLMETLEIRKKSLRKIQLAIETNRQNLNKLQIETNVLSIDK